MKAKNDRTVPEPLNVPLGTDDRKLLEAKAKEAEVSEIEWAARAIRAALSAKPEPGLVMIGAYRVDPGDREIDVITLQQRKDTSLVKHEYTDGTFVTIQMPPTEGSTIFTVKSNASVEVDKANQVVRLGPKNSIH